MKTLVKAVLATTLLAASATHASEDKRFVFVGDTQYAGFCQAVAMDNLKQLKYNFNREVGSLSSSRRRTFELLLDANNMSCNGEGLVDFAKSRDADEVIAFLNTKLESL